MSFRISWSKKLLGGFRISWHYGRRRRRTRRRY